MVCAKKRRDSIRGSVFVETVIGLPVFMFFVLASIELARYYYVSSFIEFAAWEAADFLSKSSIEEVTTNTRCSNDQSPCLRYSALLSRAQQIVQSRTAPIADSSVTTRGRASLIRFVHFGNSFYDPNSKPAPGLLGRTLDLAILRPGEAVIDKYKEEKYGTELAVLSHISRMDYAKGVQNGLIPYQQDSVGWPRFALGKTWQDVLKENPLMVKVSMNYRPLLLPFNVRIDSVEMAYRNSAQGGLLRAGILPSPSPTPTLGVGPDGSPLPTPLPTATTTPFVVATPTPTQTPRPTPPDNSVNCANDPCITSPCYCLTNPGASYCVFCSTSYCSRSFSVCG
jgi:hypothetical protein